jgi:hypothetical protein
MSDVRSPTELKTWMRLRSKDGDEVLIPRDNWYLRAARLFTYYLGQSCSLGDWWYVPPLISVQAHGVLIHRGLPGLKGRRHTEQPSLSK